MSRKTAHGALKDLCLMTAQRRNHDVTFRNHPVGAFIPLEMFNAYERAVSLGVPPPRMVPVMIGRKGELDTWGSIDGGGHFWMEVKGPGDKLSPEQEREIANLQRARVPCYVVKADRVEDFNREAEAFAEWVAGLPRR